MNQIGGRFIKNNNYQHGIAVRLLEARSFGLSRCFIEESLLLFHRRAFVGTFLAWRGARSQNAPRGAGPALSTIHLVVAR